MNEALFIFLIGLGIAAAQTDQARKKEALRRKIQAEPFRLLGNR